MSSKTKSKGSSGSVSRNSGASKDDLKNLENLFELMKRHEIAELEWEKAGERVHLKTQAAFLNSGSILSASPIHASPLISSKNASLGSNGIVGGSQEPESKEATQSNPNQKQVLSPFVGTFYRASSPNAEPYVREGQTVKRGDVLCIIEAMKLMNEIDAEFPGKIHSCLVENGQPVEFGEPLFLIET